MRQGFYTLVIAVMVWGVGACGDSSDGDGYVAQFDIDTDVLRCLHELNRIKVTTAVSINQRCQ